MNLFLDNCLTANALVIHAAVVLEPAISSSNESKKHHGKTQVYVCASANPSMKYMTALDPIISTMPTV